MTRNAETVRRSGSPGPAPTMVSAPFRDKSGGVEGAEGTEKELAREVEKWKGTNMEVLKKDTLDNEGEKGPTLEGRNANDDDFASEGYV